MLAIATNTFAEDDIRNISKPVREMTLMKILLAMLSMNMVFNRVSVQEKKQLRKLENKGKALLRAEAAVVSNEICFENNSLPTFTIVLSPEVVFRNSK